MEDLRSFGSCYDCGRRYGDEHGFSDLIVPDAVWAMIAPRPSGGGLLCACCITRRMRERGITGEGRWTSGPLAGAQ